MKLKRALNFLMLAAALVCAVPDVLSAGKAPVWEVVALVDVNESDRTDLSGRENVEIENREGILYIAVNKPVKIEIYSILGQLITSKSVKPGTVRLTLNQRGVYILKAGSTTRRINL